MISCCQSPAVVGTAAKYNSFGIFSTTSNSCSCSVGIPATIRCRFLAVVVPGSSPMALPCGAVLPASTPAICTSPVLDASGRASTAAAGAVLPAPIPVSVGPDAVLPAVVALAVSASMIS